MAVTVKIEICAFTFEACTNAELGGANRIELCDNPGEGGTTPSYGLIKRVREKVSLKLYPIIRPRGGNYFYSDDEFEIMLSDVKICKTLGCDGVSIGTQKIDGTIDIDRMKRIVDTADGMGVTCNRAFDLTPNPVKALEDLINAGCERVLTSGQEMLAPEAPELLAKLVNQAGNRIIVMPGSGVRPENVGSLAAKCRAKEYHSAARRYIDNPMTFQNPKVHDLGRVVVADADIIRAIRKNAEAALL
ncbi:MAG: copper homeostasis protein CutC [Fibrobacteres bacterium]|nr:copper homeostasis protein CutC [Fibrobacterota bacterium]